jgi:TolB-like protein/class 3 adenylate cyclase/Tfp pilus assembly protein PilF
MSAETKKEIGLEIAHVLFIDIVDYSKLSVNEQHARIGELNDIVRLSEQFGRAEAASRLLKIPTGDGMALVFYKSPEEPAQCAVEISRALKDNARLQVRMGIHSGPISGVVDVNEHTNVAGTGINMAQRVMDCGDGGHILVSKHTAEDLEAYDQWRPVLHDLGTCEVKHGVRMSVTNLYSDEVGNPKLPSKLAVVKKHRARARWAGVTIVLLALAVVVASFFFLLRRPMRSALAIREKSIAVLPFENLSEEKANAYFVEGIQDEILTRLAKIADLKVVSRTSTQKYKSSPDNLREVGNQLGVANLLEGSVQKIAGAVHINVQLIRAATDEHVWAESYNRKLDDVFGVEGEVASAIADQLNAKLTGTEEKAISNQPTQNLAAYDAYLRGLSTEHNPSPDNTSYQQAAAAYATAVQLDPKFALAWARLGVTRSYLYFNGIDTNTNSREAVKEAADRAIALQPELGEAWIAQGAYRYRVQEDFTGALQTYNEAQKRLPNSSFVLENMAFVERRLGLWKEAEAHYKKAVELDPRNLSLLVGMAGDFLNYLRRFDDAQAAFDRALEISPGNQEVIAGKAFIFQSEGRLDEAAKQLARIPADSEKDEVVLARVFQAEDERRFDAAIALIEAKVASLTQAESLNPISNLFLVHLGYCQDRSGRPEQARISFLRAIQALKGSQESAAGGGRHILRLVLGMAYAGLGDKTNALDQAHHAADEAANDAVFKPQAEIWLAQIEACFGDIDSAIAVLPHLLEVPAGLSPADLRYDPLWDPLRNDPRFQKLAGSEAPKH